MSCLTIARLVHLNVGNEYRTYHSASLQSNVYWYLICLQKLNIIHRPGVNIICNSDIAAATIKGLWEGYYGCGGKNLTLSLDLQISGTNTLNGTLQFSNGTFLGVINVVGLFADSTGNILITTRSWISRPPGVEPLTLDGVYSYSGDIISGQVATQSCETFYLARVSRSEYLGSKCLANAYAGSKYLCLCSAILSKIWRIVHIS